MQRRQCGTREIAGTDRVVDYTREDFTPSGETYAVIFDAVGNLSESQGNRALKPNEIYLNVHKASDNGEKWGHGSIVRLGG